MRATKRSGLIVFLLLLGIFLIAGVRIAAQTSRESQLTTARFRVVFEGAGELRAIEIKGLGSESDVDLSGGFSKAHPQRQLKPVHLVIIRKAARPDKFWEWRANILAGRKDMRAGRVDLLDHNREPVLTWQIIDAWPSKWVWPEFDANNPTPALEAIHFVAREVRPAGRRVISLPKLPKPIKKIKR